VGQGTRNKSKHTGFEMLLVRQHLPWRISTCRWADRALFSLTNLYLSPSQNFLLILLRSSSSRVNTRVSQSRARWVDASRGHIVRWHRLYVSFLKHFVERRLMRDSA